jgi:NADH dehydrogenase (ubiquinone) 1 beta subcomplex subunit 8
LKPLVLYNETKLTTWQNGGYINPPRIKRSHRDPYADWWDKQERRNYGEPVHEDNDMLGIFSFEDYDVFTSKKAFLGWAWFIGGIATLSGIVYLFYPDRPATKRTAPGGLLEEYGGPGGLSVS